MTDIRELFSHLTDEQWAQREQDLDRLERLRDKSNALRAQLIEIDAERKVLHRQCMALEAKIHAYIV